MQFAGLAEALERLEQDVLGDVPRILAVANEPDREVVDAERMLAMKVGEGGMLRSVVVAPSSDAQLQLHPGPLHARVPDYKNAPSSPTLARRRRGARRRGPILPRRRGRGGRNAKELAQQAFLQSDR